MTSASRDVQPTNHRRQLSAGSASSLLLASADDVELNRFSQQHSLTAADAGGHHGNHEQSTDDERLLSNAFDNTQRECINSHQSAGLASPSHVPRLNLY